MKKIFALAMLAATLLSAEAQLFSRESLGGAALGGLAGGIIGHNSGRKTAEGVAIGAGAGLLLGAITHNARRQVQYIEASPTYVVTQPQPVPTVSVVAPPMPQQVSVINNHYGASSRMSSANSLFGR